MTRTIPAIRPARRHARLAVERLESRALPTSGPVPPTDVILPIEITAPQPLPPGATAEGSAADQSTTAWAATTFTGLVSFTVPGFVLDAGDFQVSIDWGDGSTGQATPESPASGGLIVGPSGPIYAAQDADPNADYTITFDASHTYTQAGTYTFTASYGFGVNPTVLATASGTVAVGPADPADIPSFTATAPDLTATAGVPVALPATFTGPASAIDDGYFTDAATFGDGSTAGTFDEMTWEPGDAQTTVVYAEGHVYQAPGTYTYQVTLLIQGAAAATATGTVTVVAPDPSNPVVTGSAPDVTATAGQPVDLAASFTGPAAAIALGVFNASTSFGDGSSDQGMDAGFDVAAAGDQVTYTFTTFGHVYQAPGTYTYQVAFLTDGVTLATATGSVTVVASQGGSGGTGSTPPTGAGPAIPPVFYATPTASVAVAVAVPTAATSTNSTVVGYGPQVEAVVLAPAAPALAVADPASAAVPAGNPFALPSGASPFVVSGGVPGGPILDVLWAGLYTTTGPTPGAPVAAPSLAGAPSTPSDPLLFDVTYWDPALQLLTT